MGQGAFRLLVSFAARVLISVSLVSYPFIDNIKRSTLGILLAVSAGALVYVGASHLLPAVERENKAYSILALVAGVLVALFVVMAKN